MIPIDALMQEHRIIDRIVPPIRKEISKIEENGRVEPKTIETVVDFVRTYGDRCHHGKEEGILFRELAKKPLSVEHATMMKELIEDHVYLRKTTSTLQAANVNYMNGNLDSAKEVAKSLKDLAEFYPRHVEKEDKIFFYPSMEYFTPQEQEVMLREFWDFDRRLIHENYSKVVSELEKIGSTQR